MKLIAPQRPDIPGYAVPAGPDIHPCALITGFPWPSDHRAANWCYLPRAFTIDKQVSEAERLAKAAPEGARAVVLAGLHADTGAWVGEPPPAGTVAWYTGWEQAVYALSREMVHRGVPQDTLIIGQSEHHPLGRWIDTAYEAAYPFQFCNYFALSDPESPHVYAPGHAAMPGLYATDHRTYSLDHVAKWLRGHPREVIPWITEPVVGDETNWKTALNICQLLGANRAVLFADHREPAKLPERKAALEQAFVQVGNWTGGDIGVAGVWRI